MDPQLQQYLPLIIGVVLALAFLAWIVLRSNRTTTIVGDETSGKDVLDEGGTKPKRNQALIDGHESVEHSFGDTSAAANTRKVAHASEQADAEAGVSVAPTVGDPVPPPPSEAEAQQPADAVPPKKTSTPAAAGTTNGDDLRRIKGVGPKLVTLLNEQGITRFDQIAAWDDADIDRVDAGLGRFQGRIRRDQWVEQAKFLAAGDDTGFAERFGQNS
ncbi:MAG: hypothetical protein V2I43_03750 [Parvularcula sp.]|jgi:predicted flap endonuclease-1-like 5' DNA nuclease|nr:hypothetical protein [Parvularcula sp.]